MPDLNRAALSVPAFLKRALRAGHHIQPYDARAYQITAARKCASALLDGRHSVLTLPTGTGKTLICGMAAAVYLRENPGERVVVTAPRRALISQLATRSRWLNPTSPTRAIGTDPRENDQHVRAAFAHAEVIFSMPEFLTRRIRQDVIREDRVADIGLLIVDEFDAFLTQRYLASGVRVSFHEAFQSLLDAVPESCRILMVSATTPEKPKPAIRSEKSNDYEKQMDNSIQAAFRGFLDTEFDPKYVEIQERYYRDFIPHAEIHAVPVTDREVIKFDAAVRSEFGLLVNWISGALQTHIDPNYVLPRLDKILSGEMSIAPFGPRLRKGSKSVVAGLLSRLQMINHIPDFLFEDMFRDFAYYSDETSKYDNSLTKRLPVSALRIEEPGRSRDGRVEMWPSLRGKRDVLLKIVRHHKGQKGVLFFRNIRVLNAVKDELIALGYRVAIVHGKNRPDLNDRRLNLFRREENILLLITRDTGKRGLDLPEADYAIFYSPKAREDVTWQEVSRIRSTVTSKKASYFLFYESTSEQDKMAAMLEALERTTHSKNIGLLNPSAIDREPFTT
ncbi:hypothetical protein B6V75_10050 [Thioclava sp. F1Mire-8]|uniref:DEAD/DEAH box helicase n=1 Tax=Thioclava sp. F1Mire-8 TaxID=1973006 RepID=UPI000B53A803|nr:DEAD/DEAH box helicase [Thioclava sp. F1Mire-8]OWY03753.1 hypothetical protein B6V75_10050 [Thioclava sp. F1Mire-8]